MERRFTPNPSPIRIETREDGGKTIVGYGAVFYRSDEPGTEYAPVPEFRERIARGAFDNAIKRPDDVRGLFNHNPDHLLGRTTARTMRLSVDSRGLRYEIDIPDTQTGRDVAESIRRGDLSGSSFAFTVDEQGWDDRGDELVREIRDLTLYDAGPVTFPAYEATTTDLRNEDHEYARYLMRKARKVRSERMRRLAMAEAAAAGLALIPES